MKHTLVIVLLVCTLWAMAAVPKNRTNHRDESDLEKNNVKIIVICAPQTPCAWTVYNAVSKIISSSVTNTFCICGEGTSCVVAEDDLEASLYVSKCREKPES